MHGACKYTPEIAKEICERLAQGESLKSICRDDHLPSDMSVRRWVIEDYQGFASQYAHARDIGLDVIAEETFEIVDDNRNDWVERENKRTGEKYIALNEEAVARARIRLDQRKWYLSKLAPKRYGDRIHQELTNPDGSLQGMSNAQLAAALNNLAAQAVEAADDGADLV